MTGQEAGPSTPGRWFLVKWVLATTAGWWIAALFFRTMLSLGIGVPPPYLWGLAGISVGILQWIALRRYLLQSGWWVWATMVGYAVGVTWGHRIAWTQLTSDVFRSIGFELPLLLVFERALGGVFVGIMQWLVLRRQVSNAGWWVLVSSGAYAAVSSLSIVRMSPTLTPLQAAMIGAFTGIVLNWLLRNPLPREKDGNKSDSPSLPN